MAGNDPGNGSGKVWYTSRFADNVTVIDMGGLRVSSACGIRHPAKCRNLVVNSTHHGDYVSTHAVFIPLENGLYYVVEITHNGSSRSFQNYTSHNTFHVNPSIQCPSNCVSVGIFQIGTHYYSLCVTLSDSVCTCQIYKDENTVEYFLRSCHRYGVFGTHTNDTILRQLSNVIASHNPRQPHLFFFIGRYLYQINPIAGTKSQSYIVSDVCSSLKHVTLLEHKLHMYCANESAIYDLNDGLLIHIRQLELFYQCSSTTNVTIDLGVAERLTYTSEDTEKTRTIALPGSSVLRFGTCFILQNNSIFLYLDQNDGVYLFNGTTNEFHHVNNTQGCIMDQCQWPQVFNNHYLAVRGSGEDSVVVYDVEEFQTPILTLHRVSYQVGVVIDNLQISQRAELTTTISASHASTLHLSPSPVLTISSAVMMTSLIPSSSLVILIQSPISTAVTTHDPTLNEVDNFNIIGTVIFPTAVIIIIVIIFTTSIIVPVYITYR